MNIAQISIKRPVFIVMIVLSIITVGIIGYNFLPVELLPNIDFPVLTVITVYPGASAEDVESMVTKPLENSLGTIEGLDVLSSVSSEGVSRVIINFKVGTDIKFAEIKVREKVQTASSVLPKDINDPLITRFSSDDFPILFLSVQGNRELADLQDILDNEIRPNIEVLEGVGAVQAFGGQNRVINIIFDKSLLLANGITYKLISQSISSKNISFPIGEIKGNKKDISVRVYGKAQSIDDIGNITLTSTTGKVIRIKDIAKIEFGIEEISSIARVNGENAIIFSVLKQSGGNAVKVANLVKENITEIIKTLPGDIKINVVSDTSKSIERSIKGVQEDILIGALLAIIIVWLFLGNFRSTMITALALPNSLLGAFFLIYIAGFSINVITLLSLSLSIGLLIDDSIVVRENIFRYIEQGLSPKEAAIKGTTEVGLAVLATTLSIMAVFIPISFLSGMIGQFLRQFGLTVAFALLISLLDAFTTAPMLSAYWYKKEKKEKKGIGRFFAVLNTKWNKFYDKFNQQYQIILKWALNHKKTIIFGTIALFVITIPLSTFIGVNFINVSNSGQFTVNIETFPGANLNTIDSYVVEIEKFLKDQKDIEVFWITIGQSGGNSIGQSQGASISVLMKELKKRKLTTQDLMAITREFIKSKYDKELVYKLTEQSNQGGGGSSPIAVNIYGNDLKILESLSMDIKKYISEVPGAVDISSSLKPGTPEIVISLDNMKAEKLGISAIELSQTLRELIQGTTVSKFSQEEKDYDIILKLDQSERKQIDDLKNIFITTRTGKKVLLSAICDFKYSSAPIEIQRENKKRIVKVSGNIQKGYDLSGVINEAKKLLEKNIIKPKGYDYEFVGQQKNVTDLFQQMLLAMALALIFMYMILASLYNSFTQPLILMTSTLLAIIGALLALVITGVDLDFYGFIGILLVLGLVAKNAILLIDFTNTKRKEGMSIRDALLLAGPVRLRPILMTTFALIFGMLPIALGLNEGSSGRQALPITVIGGLLTSTFLTLVVVPVIYEWMEKLIEKRKAKKAELLKLSQPVE